MCLIARNARFAFHLVFTSAYEQTPRRKDHWVLFLGDKNTKAKDGDLAFRKLTETKRRTTLTESSKWHVRDKPGGQSERHAVRVWGACVFPRSRGKETRDDFLKEMREI